MPPDQAAELIDEGTRAERHGILDRAIACFTMASGCADPALRARALTHLADAHRMLAEWDPALEAARRARAVAGDSQLSAIAAEATIAEANVLNCRGDFAEALALYRGLLDEATDARVRGIALQNIGSILAQQGQLGAAERAFAESYGCFQHAGYRRGEAIALNNYGRVNLDRGETKLAAELLDQALEVAREVEDAELIALARLNLAEAIARQGSGPRAADLVTTALGYFATSGNRWRQVECLRLLGSLHEAAGDRENAGRCFRRGLCLAEEIGAQVEVSSLRECVSRVSAGGSAR